MKLKFFHISLVSVLFLVTLAFPEVVGGDGEKRPPTPQERAVEHVARTHHLPIERLTVLGGEAFTNEIAQTQAGLVTVFDTGTKTVYQLVVDAGRVMEYSDYREMQGKARREKYGKLSPSLHDLLESKTPGDKVKVGIWLKSDAEQAAYAVVNKYPKARLAGIKPTAQTDMQLYEQIKVEMWDAMKQSYQASQRPILAAINAAGHGEAYAATLAPIVFAELPKTFLLELANRTDVDAAYEWVDDYRLALDVAVPTVGVPPQGLGFDGTGIRVAVIEPGAIDFDHDNLRHARPENPEDWYFIDPPNKDNHPTSVAGIIAADGTNGNAFQGIAKGATLLSGNVVNLNDQTAQAATDWAIANGADIINLSWGKNQHGEMQLIDRYYDHIAFWHFKTVVASAGNGPLNEPDPEPWWVTSPATAYNVIAVGAFDDHGFVTWAEDTIWPWSSYQNPNPVVLYREKPEVAAPGVDITSTRVDGAFGTSSGTSLAAPMVAGEAALLMQQNDYLKLRPELVKAIIMASASHNIEGAHNISDRDGVGGISAEYASSVLAAGQFSANNPNGRWDWQFFLRESGQGQLSFPPGTARNHTVFANAGDRVRAVVTWPSHVPDQSPWDPDTLSTSLDLFAYSPDGRLVDYSATVFQNFEILDFVATTTGIHLIQLANSFMLEDSEWYAIAWDVRPVTAPDRALVSHLKFDEGVNTIVNDSSSQSHHATLAAAPRDPEWTGSAAGLGNALSFDGDDYVAIPYSANLEIPRNLAVEAWVYPTQPQQTNVGIVTRQIPGLDRYAFVMSLWGGKPFFSVWTEMQEAAAGGWPELAVNQWHHLVGTYDGSAVRLYVNGSLVSTVAKSGNIDFASGGAWIGRKNEWGAGFVGKIDNVRIYNAALSPDQAMAAFWKMDEGATTVAADSSGHAGHGTLGPAPYDPEWTVSNPGLGSALSFDGDDYLGVPYFTSLDIATNLSVDMWIYPTQAGQSNVGIISRQKPGQDQYTYLMSMWGGKPFFSVWIGGQETVVGAWEALAPDQWHHVTGTYDGSAVKLYVNGNLVGSAPRSGNIDSSSGGVWIGRKNEWGAGFIGKIDEVGIYSRILSP